MMFRNQLSGLFGYQPQGFMVQPQANYLGLFQQRNPFYGNPLQMPQQPAGSLSPYGLSPTEMWAGFTSDRTPDYVPVDEAKSIDQVAPGDQNQWLFNYLSGGG